ncbi:tetratricopeptide repeat protein [Xanthobacter autotrophicus DSM 431]|uniref:O-linked N-acetylglucosamine transferase, SPINDLY family protein n=1 Tax=Xanthobacter nonsaccharivorans TaxID=3119912 RepID=UPI00372B261D
MSSPQLPPDLAQQIYDGYQFQLRGRYEEAANCYRRVLRRLPKHADVMHLLAMVRARQGRTDEALALYGDAAALKPQDAKLWHNYGLALGGVERNAEAAAAFARALSLDPSLPEGLGMLFSARRAVCDWRDDDALRAGLARAGTPGQPEVPAFFTLWLDDPDVQLRAARQVVARRCAGITPRPLPAGRAPGRLRIGYVSADFRRHPTTHLLARLLELHDRERFEITAFSIGPDDGSDYRKRIERSVDRFVDCAADPTPEATAGRARALNIDVLVDLMGHTDGNRIEVFAHRGAPVQAAFLGYPGTTGAPFMDYVIADPAVLPLAEARTFAEKVAQLPDAYQPNDPTLAPGPRPTRADCGLPEEGVVFCAFNNLRKVDPDTFAIWMRLLSAVPGSVLWLIAGDAARANLVREAEARGIGAERLVFAPPLPLEEHLARLALADLFLDTFPYTAHTTASDALRMGVPLVTRTGRTFASRVAASLLHQVGLDDLVTADLRAFEAKAVALARDPAALGAAKARLDAARATSPLYDTARFARHMEAACETMVARFRAGLPPDAFAVEALPRG